MVYRLMVVFINAVCVVFLSWGCLDVGVDFCFLFFSGDGCKAARIWITKFV